MSSLIIIAQHTLEYGEEEEDTESLHQTEGLRRLGRQRHEESQDHIWTGKRSHQQVTTVLIN